MSGFLTAEDLAKPVLKEVTIIGKKAFIRPLTFDDQLELEKIKSMTTMLKTAVVLALCDKDGKPIFKSKADGMKAMSNVSAADLTGSFAVITEELEGQSAAIKKLGTAQKKRSRSGSP